MVNGPLLSAMTAFVSVRYRINTPPILTVFHRPRSDGVFATDSGDHGETTTTPSTDHDDDDNDDDGEVLSTTITSTPSLRIHDGPVLTDLGGIVTGFTLAELGLDVVVAPSMIAPGTHGLFASLSEGIGCATVPRMEPLCGYARRGAFRHRDVGDKTVGFALSGPETAVFYERQLMSVMDAIQLAATTRGDGICGLAGHVLVQQEEEGRVDIHVDTEDTNFKRYYVPTFLNKEEEEEESGEEDDELMSQDMELSVGNIGQFCNDLAWSYDDPPTTKEEYDARSVEKNAIQLVWRLEFDEQTQCLIPTWPVSVLVDDMMFQNADTYMELGTKYGWNYWQATLDMRISQNSP